MKARRSRLLAQFVVSIAFLAITGAFSSMSFADNSVPATEKEPVTDAYHGEKVVDDYRWLEDGASPKVKAWTEKQNEHTRAYLDRLPDRAVVQTQLKTLKVRQESAELRVASLASWPPLCPQVSTAETTAPARGANLTGRSRFGKSRARSKRNRTERTGGHGLVCAFAGWTSRRGLPFGERQRGWRSLFLRYGHRQGFARQDRARAVPDGRRQRGVDAGWEVDLLHPLSTRR